MMKRITPPPFSIKKHTDNTQTKIQTNKAKTIACVLFKMCRQDEDYITFLMINFDTTLLLFFNRLYTRISKLIFPHDIHMKNYALWKWISKVSKSAHLKKNRNSVPLTILTHVEKIMCTVWSIFLDCLKYDSISDLLFRSSTDSWRSTYPQMFS